MNFSSILECHLHLSHLVSFLLVFFCAVLLIESKGSKTPWRRLLSENILKRAILKLF